MKHDIFHQHDHLDHDFVHWAAVGLVAAVAIFAFSEVHGQTSGAAAARAAGQPFMAGANGGQGVQAGVAQGGIGAQGNDAAERTVRLSMPLATGRAPEPGEVASPNAQARAEVVAADKVAPAPKRDGVAKEQRSASKKAARAAKRSADRARTGVGQFDSSGGAAVAR
jgi:hypothetical protein